MQITITFDMLAQANSLLIIENKNNELKTKKEIYQRQNWLKKMCSDLTIWDFMPIKPLNVNRLRNLKKGQGHKVTDEEKTKIKNTMLEKGLGFQKGNTINKGRIQFPEEIANRTHTMLKVMQTKEYKEAHHKGMLGRQVSESTRKKIAESRMGEKHWTTRLPYPQSAILKLREKRLHQVFPKVDSTPEKILQIALKLEGINYEKHIPIIGQPDIFINPNLCVFVDGCYFHGCKGCYPNNWDDKIPIKNVKHDLIVNTELKHLGYHVMRIYDHEISNNVKIPVDRILDFIKIGES